MNLFSKTATAREVEPTVQEQRAMREAELLADINKITDQCDLLRSLIQTFQTEHFVILNGQTHFAVSDPAELDSLRGTWSGLCAEAARLSDSRNRALHEWSELHSDR